MAEAIQSRDAFYINGMFRNNSTYAKPAEVIVTDDTSLLERTEGYCIHVTRWALDTQSSMFFIKKDETASKFSIKTVGHGDSTALTASRSLRIYRL